MLKYQKILSVFGILLLLAILLIPIAAYAQNNWIEYIPENLRNVGGGNVTTLITNIIRILLILAGVVALIYLIIGGYQYVTAGGNAEQATAARTTILNAIIGLVIVFASYAILTWVITYFLTGRAPTP